jgi:glycosyltransferase involved in cell wall biosynthesis
MNILVANWTWYPSGGDWTYIDNVTRLYRKHGHTIIPFSMQDARNYSTPFSKYFIDHIDYKTLNETKTINSGIEVLKKSIYSKEARIKLSKLLEIQHIDIAHLNNINNYLTLSIISVLKKKGIKIIWTLHDHKILCPNTTFFSDDAICESCKGAKFYNCTLKRCKRGSYLASFIASLESYFNVIADYYSDIDYFICPSRFLHDKVVEYGFSEKKVKLIPNCYDTELLTTNVDKSDNNTNDYILFIGRLEKIKGVLTLIKAFAELNSNVRLKIIGDGSQRKEIESYLSLRKIQNVDLEGIKSKNDVIHFIRNCMFTVCPSESYENFPFSIVEAMHMGKPVIGSKIGGIPELIIDQKTGFTFQPGSFKELSQKIEILSRDKELINFLGKNAKIYISEITDMETHYKRLEALF